MNEASADMLLVEHYSCPECPLVRQPGFLGRLVGLKAKTNRQFNYCRSKGPESLVVGGIVAINYAEDKVQLEPITRLICSAHVTQEDRSGATALESQLYDRFEEAHVELDERRAHPDETSVADRQVVSRTRYSFPRP